MSDNQEREAPSAPAPSRIVLTFPGLGQADCTIALEGVTPGQVMSAAWFLDTFARELRAGQVPGVAPRLVLADHLPPTKGPRQ